MGLLQTFSFALALHGPGAAGQNKQHSITKNTAKLDRETEELHHDRVTLEVGKVIQQGRQSKGLTQKDLATVSARPPAAAGRAGAGPGSPETSEGPHESAGTCRAASALALGPHTAVRSLRPSPGCVRLPPPPGADGQTHVLSRKSTGRNFGE